jgi:signal-transduction protein with cAMP-binding, CBS, and nucleotidyltransferase domain
MDNKFVQHFSKISPLSAEEAAAIAESMRVETFKKGTMLLREGQISVDTYFIMEGCIWEYVLSVPRWVWGRVWLLR